MARVLVVTPKVGQPTGDSLTKLSEALTRLSRVSLVANDWADLGRRLQLGITSFTRLVDLMAPLGWVIPLRYTPRETHELLKLHATDGPDAVAAALLQDFRAVSAREAVKDHVFADNPVLGDSLSAMRMAAEAHDRGEYPLSIPIWLIATDRIARQCLGIEPYSIQSPSGKAARAATTALAPFGSIAPAAAQALITVFTGLGGHGREQTVLNRHEVLQGLRPIAGSETESVQCFLALQMLAHLASRETSRSDMGRGSA